MYFLKMLITENETLCVKLYTQGFTRKNNIFILKQDEELNAKKKKELEDFLRKDFKIVSKEVKKQYTIENWLEKLIKYYIQQRSQ